MPTPNDYRIFVGAFPIGDLADRIQAVRERYDPTTARITAPHVTLAGSYWRDGPATPDNEAATIERLLAIQDRLPPFDLNLGGIHAFLPDAPVIFLRAKASRELWVVRQILMETLGFDKQRQFTPHLTLTMRLPEVDTRALFAELRQSEWHTRSVTQRLDHLWLMQRGKHDKAWRYLRRIELRKT